MKKTQSEKVGDLLRLNLTPQQAKLFVPQIEQVIAAAKEKLNNELLPPFREIETKYLAMKSEIEIEEKIIEENLQLLETIIRGGNGNKETRMLRTTSHVDPSNHRSKEARANNIRWKDEFKIILETNQRFMSFDGLVSELSKRYPNRKEDIEQKRRLQYTNIEADFKAVLQRIKEGRQAARNGVELLQYKNKIGLRAWFDEKNVNNPVPFAKYIKEFMYANGNGVLVE